MRKTTLIKTILSASAASASLALAGELTPVMYRLGLSPEHLAAAGFEASEVEAMLGRIHAAKDVRAQLDGAASQVETSLQLVNELTGKVADDPGDGALGEQLEHALAAFAVANSSVTELQTELLSSAVQGADADKVAALAACNLQAYSALPPEMRVVGWTDEDQDRIETALSMEADAAARGEQVDPETASILTAKRSNPKVIAAVEGLQAEKAELEDLVEQFDEPK